MIAFAFVNQNGIPTGGGMRREVPKGAVVLPAPFTTLDLPRLRFRDGAWEERPQEPEPFALTAEEVAAEQAAMAADLLRRARKEAVDRVNRRVGQFRARFETDIPGQAEIYADKRREALAYLREVEVTGAPATLDAYELIAAEVGITAPTALQVAELWLAKSTAAKVAARRSERLRQSTLRAIAEAPSFDAIETLERAFNEALNSLPL